MKFKSTLILLLIAMISGGGLYFLIKIKKVPTTEQRVEQERHVVQLKAGEVSAIEIQGLDRNFQFEKRDGKWFFVKPLQVRANGAELEGLLSTIEFLQSRRMLMPEDLAEAKRTLGDYGLEKPRFLARLTARSGEVVIHVGNEARQGDALYIQIDGNPSVYLVSKDLAKRLDKKVEDYRERALFDFPELEVARMEIRNGSAFCEFNKTNGIWRITQPLGARADASRVNEMIRQLAALRAVDFLSEDPAAAKEYGLEDATQQISVGLERGDVPHVLMLGARLKMDDKKVAARVKGQNSIISIPATYAMGLAAPLAEFRDHTLVTFNPPEVTSIEVRTRQIGFSLERQESGWRLVRPDNRPADAEMVERFLSRLASLQIKEFVADVSTDVEKYGLKPALSSIAVRGKSLTDVGATNETVFLDLALGKSDSGRKIVYAQGGGESSVYGLDEAVVNEFPRSTVELLSRVLFQINKEEIASIQQKRGKVVQTLQKEASGSWRIQEAPQAVLDETALQTFLNQFERFSVQQIVGTALNSTIKQYGLDNPLCTLLINHPVENKTLTEEILVGRDTSQKKFYLLWKNQLMVCEISPEMHQILSRDWLKVK